MDKKGQGIDYPLKMTLSFGLFFEKINIFEGGG